MRRCPLRVVPASPPVPACPHLLMRPSSMAVCLGRLFHAPPPHCPRDSPRAACLRVFGAIRIWMMAEGTPDPDLAASQEPTCRLPPPSPETPDFFPSLDGGYVVQPAAIFFWPPKAKAFPVPGGCQKGPGLYDQFDLLQNTLKGPEFIPAKVKSEKK